jgi:hypothetical protein
LKKKERVLRKLLAEKGFEIWTLREILKKKT